ncbi:MAG TPA: aminopeptidase P N-terminal domain-containing protein [Gemmatimonadaceae bacterium]|nr:aminopeptidase P N-terminal domain-containing protein [Gemmatimonadaceae bacterium]
MARLHWPNSTIREKTMVSASRSFALAALALSASAWLNRTGAQSSPIPLAEYAARRDSLAARIRDGVVVALGGRTPVTDYGPFYQLPAFNYLTNFHEPDAAMVLVAKGGKAATTLFLTPIDPRTAFYYGRRPDSASVERTLGMKARAFSALGNFVDSLASANPKTTFYTLQDFGDADFARQDSLTRGQSFTKSIVAKHAGLTVKDGHDVVDVLRARKSPAEMALLRKAGEISAEGHRAAMTAPEPGHEYELQAAVEYTFMKLGGARPSYGSIVGAGQNGTQLHYMKDRGVAKPGDVVVIDAGTEYEGYAADVTRTVPVSGTFTPAQREIYKLVYDAQLAAERNSKAGMSAKAAVDSSIDIRAKGLVALGLAESADATFDPPWKVDCAAVPNACKQTYFWMIHGISHGIGLAVHDPAQFYYGDKTFKEGDAFTIEPGIYVSQAMLDALADTPKNRAFKAKVKDAVAKYENTGVRIEDSYILTDKGLERISAGAPRQIDEVEALMKKRSARVVP